MKNIYLSMIVILFVSTDIAGQSQIIFDKEQTINYLIEFNQGDNTYKQYIFSEMTKTHNTAVSNIEYTLSLKEKRQILKRGNTLDFKVSISNFNLNGDISYRDFVVGDALIPNNVSFTLKWFKGNQVLNTYRFDNIPLNGNEVSLVNMTVNDSLNANNYRIRVLNAFYDFTIENKKLFQRKINLINAYYNENQRARNSLRYLNGINIDRDFLILVENLHDLYVYRDSADASISYVNKVKQKSFYKNLPLNDNDPSNLISKLNTIQTRANELKFVCNQILDNLDQVWYERGMDMLSQRRPDKAEFFFHKSIEFNRNYAPSHFQLAALWYRRGTVDQAVDKVFEIRSMNPDYETKLQTIELAQGIYNDFLLDAGALNNLGDYDAAVNVLLRARDICSDFPEVQCRSNMDIEMSRAINGKYNYILNKIDKKIDLNELTEAENLLKDAIVFTQQNRAFIPNNDEIAERLSELYYINLEKGENLIADAEFNQAIAHFDEASRICNAYYEIYCTDELNQKYRVARSGIYKRMIYDAEQSFISAQNHDAESLIDKAIAYRKKFNLEQDSNEDRLFLDIKQAIYDDYIESGSSLHASGNYQNALEKYKSALDIENNYAVRKNSSLNTYIKTSAKGLIFSIIDDANGKVDVNNLKNARSLYNEAKDLSNRYNVYSESKVNSSLSELKGRIFKQECLNAQNKYNSIYDQALDLINKKEYINANIKLNDAINFAAQNAQCEIETIDVINKQKEINPAVNYLQKVINTKDLIKRRNYKSAILEYQSAEKYYNLNKINNFSLKHTVLFDFIRSGYTDFIVYSVGFYNYNKEFGKAIELLKELSRRGANKKIAKNEQIVLATDLATHDFNENPNADYNSNIAQYTKGDKFFKYFAKAYKKQWKRLN